jgi:predicted metalloprotease
MRLEDFRKSDNVEDDTGGASSFGGGGIKLGGGALILIVIVSLVFGINPLTLIGGLESVAPPSGQSAPGQSPPGYGPQRDNAPPGARPAGPADPSKELAARVLGDTEDVWGAIFKSMGGTYQPPTLVLFRGSVRSACGLAGAAAGPFYCAGDRKLYLDTAFFDELARRFKAPGDFAQAYVIAHEVGHHVQNLTGVMRRFDATRERTDERGANALSIRLELQADCYAGVWGYFAQQRNKLDPGDIEEGLTAAAAVGDDQIQKRTQGYVVPDSFTHGTAAQRLGWFKTGLASGDMRKCDTFAARAP